jgi:hypothetical protein
MALTGHSGIQTPQATQSSLILRDNPDHHPFIFDYTGNGCEPYSYVYSILTYKKIKYKNFFGSFQPQQQDYDT